MEFELVEQSPDDWDDIDEYLERVARLDRLNDKLAYWGSNLKG